MISGRTPDFLGFTPASILFPFAPSLEGPLHDKSIWRGHVLSGGLERPLTATPKRRRGRDSSQDGSGQWAYDSPAIATGTSKREPMRDLGVYRCLLYRKFMEWFDRYQFDIGSIS